MAQAEPTIERGMTRINVPCLDRKVVFTHPFAGPDYYANVGKSILDNRAVKLSLPDGEQTSLLLDAVYCGPEKFRNQPEAVELRDEVMRPNYLWVFQRNLWMPQGKNEGVYVQYDPTAIGLTQPLDVNRLESVLKGGTEVLGVRFSKDGRTAFAPRKTYKEGKMPADDFAKDGFIVASNKVGGAKRLAGISQSEYFTSKKPRSWIVNPSGEPVQTLSAVSDCGDGLCFVGNCHADDRCGYASGVLVSDEVGASKN